jgi:hypothetical protein
MLTIRIANLVLSEKDEWMTTEAASCALVVLAVCIYRWFPVNTTATGNGSKGFIPFNAELCATDWYSTTSCVSVCLSISTSGWNCSVTNNTQISVTRYNEPNVVVQWLTILLRIRKVPGSYLGLETGYPDRFPWFSSVHPGKCWDNSLKLRHDRFLTRSFQFIIHSSPLHSTLYSLSCWENVVINYK